MSHRERRNTRYAHLFFDRRIELRLTQAEVARRAEIDRNSYARYELAQAIVSFDVGIRICLALEISWEMVKNPPPPSEKKLGGRKVNPSGECRKWKPGRKPWEGLKGNRHGLKKRPESSKLDDSSAGALPVGRGL